MITVKQMTLSVPEEITKKILSFFKELWLGMPKWLRFFLIVTVLGGAFYFVYMRLSISYDMEDLNNEIKELNSRCETTVFYDRYQYDIQNVVTSVKTIEEQLHTITQFHYELLEILEQEHATDALHFKVTELKRRYDHSMQSYEKIIDYQIDIYEEWLKKSPRNFFQREPADEDEEDTTVEEEVTVKNKKDGSRK